MGGIMVSNKLSVMYRRFWRVLASHINSIIDIEIVYADIAKQLRMDTALFKEFNYSIPCIDAYRKNAFKRYNRCKHCPIKWKNLRCLNLGSEYHKFLTAFYAKDYRAIRREALKLSAMTWRF